MLCHNPMASGVVMGASFWPRMAPSTLYKKKIKVTETPLYIWTNGRMPEISDLGCFRLQYDYVSYAFTPGTDKVPTKVRE